MVVSKSTVRNKVKRLTLADCEVHSDISEVFALRSELCRAFAEFMLNFAII
jgi:hypothetical protein